ncbi:transcriptional regulator, TetR family [Quadrisphaera granulorum]|uniref:TetR family transcriptional regulator n=1 Tax=Quadrisphaera granulorum TaxID=317664 RepID=A0A316A1Q4_9ACTN|nr:TetR/AcrR family transcriptional regulator [Quadrisphaera granulorum]PWJ51781.1 TetR family transcriptional regulator [Quadrisphaera granulorum]SZE97728.1 transcriptional regulator, TetR family [Quadrisphaera granulorum]
MPAPTKRPSYHHGDLTTALVREGVAMARDGGPGAVVLREATRRAGVSPNAAYRHFADRDQLLGAVRVEAEQALAQAMQAEVEAVEAGTRGSPAELAAARLRATGAGYLRFARSEPGLFRTVFAEGAHRTAPGAVAPSESVASAPLRVLSTVVAEGTAAGLLPPIQDGDVDVVAWSAVHGLASLILDGPLGGLPDDATDRVANLLLAVVVTGLAHLPR